MPNKISPEKREYVRALISTSAKISRVDSGNLGKISGLGSTTAFGTSGFSSLLENDTEKELFLHWTNQVAGYLLTIDDKLDRILKKLGCEPSEASMAIAATINDISGSGMKLVLSEAIQIGQLLKISMNLPGLPVSHFEACGKVVRVSSRSGKEKGLFDVAVKFLYISEADRERLIACSFSAQRKNIRTVNETTSD